MMHSLRHVQARARVQAWSEREQRLCAFADGFGEVKKELASNVGGKEQKEGEPMPEKHTEDLVNKVQQDLDVGMDRAQKLPDPFKNAVRQNVAAYMKAAIPQYDADKNQVLDLAQPSGKSEFASYSEAMLAKVAEIVTQIGGGAEQAGAEQQKEKAAQEKKLKSLEEEMADVKEKVEKQGGGFEAREMSPEGLQEYFAEYQRESQSLQEYTGMLASQYKEITDVQAAWAAELKGGVGNAVGASTFIAGGAAAGAAIGSLAFGIGAVPGALIGAGIGTVSYMAIRAVDYAANQEKMQQRMSQVQAVMDRVKEQFERGKEETIGSVGELSERGQDLYEAPKRVAAEQQRKYQEKKQEIAEQGQEIGRQQGQVQEQQGQVGVAKVKITEQQTIISGKSAQVEAQLGMVQEAQQKAGQQRDQLQRSVETANGNQNLSDEQKQRVEQAQKGVATLGNQAEQAKQAEVTLTQAQESLKTGGQQLAEQGLELDEFDLALSESGARLTEAGEEIQEADAGVDEWITAQEDTLGQISQKVIDGVLVESVHHQQHLMQVEAQGEVVSQMKAEEPSFFRHVVDGTFEGFKDGMHGITQGLEWCAVQLEDFTKDWPPALRVGVQIVSPITSPHLYRILGGAVEGVGDLVHGVGMLTHAETWVGLGALIGRDPQTGEWKGETAGKAWTEMGKALIAYKDFEEGNISKGIGKVGINAVVTLFAPGSAGAKAAATAGRMGASFGRAAAIGAKVFLKETALMPVHVVKGVGQLGLGIVKGPATLGRWLARTPGTKAAALAERFTASTSKLEAFTINGRTVGAGANVERLAAMTDAQLAAEFGITSRSGITAGNVEKIIKLRGMLAENAGLARSAVAAERAAEMQGMSDDLVTSLKQHAKGKMSLEQIARESVRPGTEHAGKVLASSEDGILVVNKTGDLQVIKTVEMAKPQLGRAATARVLSPSELEAFCKDAAAVRVSPKGSKIFQGPEAVRVHIAERMVGRKLSAYQQDAIAQAHAVGAVEGRGIGTYTRRDLVQKGRILEEAGFTEAESRLLLDRGVCGNPADDVAAATSEIWNDIPVGGKQVRAKFVEVRGDMHHFQLESGESVYLRVDSNSPGFRIDGAGYNWSKALNQKQFDVIRGLKKDFPAASWKRGGRLVVQDAQTGNRVAGALDGVTKDGLVKIMPDGGGEAVYLKYQQGPNGRPQLVRLDKRPATSAAPAESVAPTPSKNPVTKAPEAQATVSQATESDAAASLLSDATKQRLADAVRATNGDKSLGALERHCDKISRQLKDPSLSPVKRAELEFILDETKQLCGRNAAAEYGFRHVPDGELLDVYSADFGGVSSGWREIGTKANGDRLVGQMVGDRFECLVMDGEAFKRAGRLMEMPESEVVSAYQNLKKLGRNRTSLQEQEFAELGATIRANGMDAGGLRSVGRDFVGDVGKAWANDAEWAGSIFDAAKNRMGGMLQSVSRGRLGRGVRGMKRRVGEWLEPRPAKVTIDAAPERVGQLEDKLTQSTLCGEADLQSVASVREAIRRVRTKMDSGTLGPEDLQAHREALSQLRELRSIRNRFALPSKKPVATSPAPTSTPLAPSSAPVGPGNAIVDPAIGALESKLGQSGVPLDALNIKTPAGIVREIDLLEAQISSGIVTDPAKVKAFQEAIADLRALKAKLEVPAPAPSPTPTPTPSAGPSAAPSQLIESPPPPGGVLKAAPKPSRKPTLSPPETFAFKPATGELTQEASLRVGKEARVVYSGMEVDDLTRECARLEEANSLMRDNHPFVRGRRTGKLAPLEALTEVRCTIARRVLREKVATNAGYELTPLGDIKYLNQVSGDSNWIQIGTKKGGGRLFYRFEKGTVELQRLTEAEFQQASRYTSMHFNELVQEYKVMEAKGVFRTLHAGNPLTDIRQHIQHLVDRYGFTPPWQKPNWFQRIFRRAA